MSIPRQVIKYNSFVKKSVAGRRVNLDGNHGAIRFGEIQELGDVATPRKIASVQFAWPTLRGVRLLGDRAIGIFFNLLLHVRGSGGGGSPLVHDFGEGGLLASGRKRREGMAVVG